MAANNQIEVTIANGFLTVKNVTNPNASIEEYNLVNVTSVNEYYQDYTALNAYHPGRYEYNEEFTVSIDIEENPTDLVKLDFDIQNVTNQPGWTADRNGLAQAVADIKAGVITAIAAGGGSGGTSSGLLAGSKNVAVAGTAEALDVSTAITSVTVQAKAGNTGSIAVGDATVDATPATAKGIILLGGDTITLDIDDLAKVFIDSEVSGEGVTFIYFN